jgi:DNA-binding MarR family transcriptional regulator
MPLPSTSPFTGKQGQYLAFIHTYSKLHGRPPAEADLQAFFGTTPPSVHRIIVELERRGLIRRIARQPRSIQILIGADKIPPLKDQPIKTTAARY